MVVVNRSLVIVTLLLGSCISDVGYAQHTFYPRGITQLSDIFDDAKRERTYLLSEDYDRYPTISDKGLIVVESKWETQSIIRSIDEDGATIWEKRSPEGLDRVHVTASPGGRFVVLFYTDRQLSDGTLELLTSEGKTLWTRHIVARPPHFLNSGGYLLLDGYSGEPNVVVDILSGEEQWRTDVSFRIQKWGPGLVGWLEKNNDSISFSVVDPINGPSLRRQSIDEGYLNGIKGASIYGLTSEDGKRLVLRASKSVPDRYKKKTRIGVFNQFGILLWSRDFKGYITPLGITPDSRFLVAKVYRPDQTISLQARWLELIDANTGTVIWTLQDRGSSSSPVLLTNNRLFLNANRVKIRGEEINTEHGTLILSIDSSGQLQDQELLLYNDIIHVGFRNDLQTSQKQSEQKLMLLLEEEWNHKRTLYVETIRK